MSTHRNSGLITATGLAYGAENGRPEGSGYVYRRRQRTRDAAAVRDVPRSCACCWRYHTGPARWVRAAWNPGCPWHEGQP